MLSFSLELFWSRLCTTAGQADSATALTSTAAAEGVNVTRIARTRLQVIACVLAAAGLAGCSSKSSGSPTQPSGGVTITSVSFSGTNVAVGGTAQGTVRLSAAATGSGATISLSSSNPSVITVPAAVTVPAGSDAATFSATGVNAGSASIRATYNGNSAQSASLTASRSVAILALTLSASSVVGGDPLPATITLTGPAPAGGAAVAIAAADPINAPAAVTVPAGQSSAPFTILTREVGGNISGTITATYGGGTATAMVSVTRPTAARASFGVTGPTQSETCTLSDGGNTLNCTFDGSESTAPGKITSWEWTYGVTTSRSQTTTSAVLTNPTFNCSMIPAAPLPAGTGWLSMVVKLKVRDELGNVSAEAGHGDVRLLPQGSCGY